MEILDLRPWWERRLAAGGAPGAAAAPLARLAGRLADGLAARRAARRPPPPPGVLVVSVGNLRLGGTGKTPVTVALARDLAARGIAGVVVTRGYGGAAAGPLVVAADDSRAADEARLMAGQLASLPWTVIQARRRAAGLERALAASPPPRVVILEDGFQTGGVGRHLDVLILDAWSVIDGAVAPRTGAVLPFGPYRETAAAAGRADCWLLESEQPGDAPAQGPPVTGFARRLDLRPVTGAVAAAEASVGLLAGLARPEGFEAACAAMLARPPVLAVRCRDHCPYPRPLVERILAAGAARGVRAWVTTAKDRVKLAESWPPELPLQVAELSLVWTGSKTLPDLVEERLVALGAGRPAS